VLALFNDCCCELRIINMLCIIYMLCNACKTVCMVFKPKCKRLIVASDFPCLTLNGVDLHFVSEFKFLGHMINNDLSDDDAILHSSRPPRLAWVRVGE